MVQIHEVEKVLRFAYDLTRKNLKKRMPGDLAEFSTQNLREHADSGRDLLSVALELVYSAGELAGYSKGKVNRSVDSNALGDRIGLKSIPVIKAPNLAPVVPALTAEQVSNLDTLAKLLDPKISWPQATIMLQRLRNSTQR